METCHVQVCKNVTSSLVLNSKVSFLDKIQKQGDILLQSFFIALKFDRN